MSTWKWTRKAEDNHEEFLVTFTQEKLRVAEENVDFIEEEEAEINNNKILKDTIVNTIENKEAILEIDASVKEGHVGGF